MIIKNKFQLKDFYIYLSICIFFIVFFSIFIISTFCITMQKEKQHDLDIAGNQIISKIEEDFSQLNDFLFFLGKQISVSKKVDIKNIQKIIEVLCDKASHTSPFKGIVFDWISKDNKLIYKYADNSKNNLIDMSFRSYVRDSQNSPWTLHLSSPTIGIPDGLWEIPGGMGITNPEGEFLGILAVGITVSEFNSRLQQTIVNKAASFVVLDKDMNIIFQSFDNGIDPKSTFFRQNLKERNESTEKEGKFSNPIIFNNINYTYFKKMEGYPYTYTILLGYNKDLYSHEYIKKISSYLLETIFLISTLTIVFFFLHRRRMNLFNSSQFAQEFFRKKIISSVMRSLERNMNKVNHEKIFLLKGIKDKDQKNYIDNFITKICGLLEDIRIFSPQEEEFTSVDVNEIIKECVLMKFQKFLTKGVKIYTKLRKIPELEANELCFRQMILGFIELCLDSTPKGGKITISTNLKESAEGDKILEITFIDTGLPLCREDFIRLQNKFINTEEAWNGVPSDFHFIENLVHMHLGTCRFMTPKVKGKSINIEFPYNRTSEPEKNYTYKLNEESQVVYH